MMLSLLLLFALSCQYSRAQVVDVYSDDDVIELHLGNYQYGFIQWQKSMDAVQWTDIVGANDSVYRFLPNMSAYYRALVSFDDCPDVVSGVCFVQIDEPEKEEIKVLLLGSSHGRNVIAQLPWIAKKTGIDMVVGNVYHGSLSMQNLVGKIEENQNLNFYLFRQNEDGEYSWDQSLNNSLKASQIVGYMDWDYIILQRSASDDELWLSTQEGVDSTVLTGNQYVNNALNINRQNGVSDTVYRSHNFALQYLLDLILDNVRTKIPTILFMSGFGDAGINSDAQLTHMESIMGSAEEMRKQFGIEIIPIAAAVANARITYLNNYGAGRYHGMARDSQHLDQGIGCYVASATLLELILRKQGLSILMLPDDAFGSMEEVAQLTTESTPANYTVPTPYNIATGKACALAAVNYPNQRIDELGVRFETDDREVWNISYSGLANVMLTNNRLFVDIGDGYETTITPKTGYTLTGVQVIMADEDVTSEVYDEANSQITIGVVRGDVVINVSSR